MLDSQLNQPERPVKPKFTFIPALCLFCLPFSVLAAAQQLKGLPDRRPLPDRAAAVRFEPVQVPGAAAAWSVSVADPRFGGVSGLALESGRLLALTDSGVVVTLPKPGTGGAALLHDLPSGPGSAFHKRGRDSEALARGRGDGWWVAFENRHSVWLYDAEFSRVLRKVDLRGMGWSVNKGIEAMLALPSGDLLLLTESSRQLVRVGEQGIRSARLRGVQGEIADAVRLPNGNVLVLMREIGLTGIGNRLGELVRTRAGYEVSLGQIVAVGPLTNLEAMTAEPLPSGATRLWIMSDNDFGTWRRTILLAIDLPKSA